MEKKTLVHIMSIAILGVATLAAVLLFFKYVKITHPYREPVETLEHFDIETSEITIAPDTESAGDDTGSDKTSSPCILQATNPAGADYLSKIVIMGDRTIGEMSKYTIVELPDQAQQVWSTTDNISVFHLMEVDDFLYPKTNEFVSYLTAVKDKRPQFLIVTFGSYDDPEKIVTKDDFLAAYAEFIISAKSATPNTQIIVQSILPVGSNCSVIDAETIKERNTWLIDFCEANKMYYLDTWSALSGEDGYLQPQYYDDIGEEDPNRDYFLNDTGYKKLVDYICTHVHPLYAEPETEAVVEDIPLI